jgi:tetratricopeptide (TPR) repeat protein
MHYQEAISLRPDYGDAHFNLGKVYSAQGRIDDAVDEWQTTLSLQPRDAEALASLAGAFVRQGKVLEATLYYERAIAAPVPSIYALNNLAWILSVSPDSSLRNGVKAIALARTAVTISRGQSPIFLRTLGAAYAETGNFQDAIKSAERALDLARNRQDVDLANDIEDDLAKYRMSAPVRDPNLTNGGPKT